MRVMKGKLNRFTRGLCCVGVSAAVAFSLMPVSAACALGSITQWTAPAKSDTTVTKNGTTYTYITSAGHRKVEAAADYLGISNVTVDATKTAKNFDYSADAETLYKYLSQNSRFGIFGTNVNKNLNPYYGNYFHNVYVNYIGGTNLADTDKCILIQTNNYGPTSAETTIVAAYGTSASLYYRPDILYGTGTITDKSSSSTVLVGDAASSTSGYSSLVDKIRNKELGTYDGTDLYKTGDENYDPYYVMPGATDTYTMYNLAIAAEKVITASANTSTPKITRYGDPMEIAQNYEEYILGNQYAVLKAIANGTVTKRTVGIVNSLDTTTNKITFTTSDYLKNITSNITDVDGLTDSTGTAADIMKCKAVYLSSAAQKDSLITILQSAGYNDESAYPDFYTTAPDAALQLSGDLEAAQEYGFMIGFVYPEVVNPVYAMAYYYENFYHIKDSSLADTLGMQISSMSLPAGYELNIDGYNQTTYKAMLDSGLQYYVDNKASVDSISSSLTPTSYLTLPNETPATPTIKVGQTATIGSGSAKATYKVTNATSHYVTYTRYKGTNTTAVVPQYVNVNGIRCYVTQIGYKAFKDTKAKIVAVKATKLSKARVKGSLTGSKVIKVKIVASRYSTYKSYFTKSNCGRTVVVVKL